MSRIRYRDNAGGITEQSRKRFHHVDRLGKIYSVKGYRYKVGVVLKEVVLVTGAKGTCRFSGLCWGYGGEGPSGLKELLQKYLGVPEKMAAYTAYHTSRKYDTIGWDWILYFDRPFESKFTLLTRLNTKIGDLIPVD